MKQIVVRLIRRIYWLFNHREYGLLAPSARIGRQVKVYNKKNLILEEYTNIDRGAVIMNERARLIMKANSGAAIGLTVVTGNHMSVVGKTVKQITDKVKDELDPKHEMDQDIMVEEDVWIASNVTLLMGAHIGRGAVIGAGSVVRSKIPPYAIVMGNPAKVVGFVFTPKTTVEHEEQLYEPDQRLPLETLEKNYKKYFLDRISEIKSFSKL